MSQPENHPDTEDLEPRFLHIKAIEIKFTGTRPRYPFSIKIQLKDKSKDSLPSIKSREFGKNEDVLCWEPEKYFHFPISTDFVILVRVVHRLRPKKVFAAFAISSADIAGKDAYSAADENGRAELGISCVTVSQTGDFAKILVEEAEGQVGNKKVFLESLGKASEILAFLMPFTELASDVHPAVGAAVKLVNVLYEKCKLQKECHEAAVHLMKDLLSFLPFVKDPPQDLLTNAEVKKTVTRMLELFCEISRSIIRYSSVGYLGDLIIPHKEKFDSLKGDFESLKGVYDWHFKVATWKSIMETKDIVAETGSYRATNLYLLGIYDFFQGEL
ncbi:hypothetical protein M0805_007050 [Coniferiporia weirii]|nr:hypothetical protein M0805_007050 [Coniferiporia weirii]